MKKIVIEKPGSYEKLVLKEFPDPKPGKGEVLIDCKACGVNFADCCVRMGVYSSAKKYVGWPITPGFEVSGIVRAVGEGVHRFSVGQKVIALSLFGGYTSHLTVHESFVYPLPNALSFTQGAAVPTIFLTAYYALLELAHPRPGSRLLIHSAAGGVGGALIQLGKLLECHVTGVVGSSHKVEAALQLGADKIIDKSRHDLWKEAELYDVILDANGPETLKQSYRHLATGGKLVVYGFHTMLSKGRGTPNWFKIFKSYLTTPRFNPLQMTTDNHSVMAFNLSYMFSQAEILQEAVGRLMEWFENGKLVPPTITCFPLEQTAEAHKALESGQTIGKIVLIP